MMPVNHYQGRTCCGEDVADAVLVKRALTGNEEAFAFLLDRYRQPLTNSIDTLLQDSELTCDVLQHVSMQLYIHLPTLSTRASLKGWLFRVARNRCLDELRRRQRHVELHFSALESDYWEERLSPLENIFDNDPLPDEVAELTDLHRALQQALLSLPARHRRIVYLHSFGQLSFSEISSLLNVPEYTVKASFYRSLPLLRRPFENMTTSIV